MNKYYGKLIDPPVDEIEYKRLSERATILAELDALDRRSARALRAVVAGAATEEDKAALASIETEAVSLRSRLRSLQ